MRAPRYAGILSCLFAACCLAVFAADGGDWPSWNGPNQDLTASGNDVFQRPVIGLERAWSRPLGSGYTGLPVVGGRLVAGFAEGDSDFVAALDASTGEELWRYRIGEIYKGHEGSDDGPLSTMTIQDGRVYGLGPRGKLFALRLSDGHEVWASQLVEKAGAKEPLYGFATAPTLVGGVLVVQTGGTDGHSISGFDPKKGKLLWSTGDDTVNYQSPTALRVGQEEQIVALTNRHVLGLSPRKGDLLWSHRHTTDGDGFVNTQLMAVGEGRVLLAGMGDSVLLRVEKGTDGYRVEEQWRTRALYGSLSTPAPFEGHLYGFVGRRFLTCVDAQTGETVWKSREPGGGSLVLVDGHLVILAQNGDLVVIEATPAGYTEKARIKALETGSLTWPSFGDGRIYVRNLTDIAGIAVTGEAAAVTADAEPLPEIELLGELKTLEQRLAAAEDKDAVIEEFLSSHDSYPILEGENLVHFVFRGEVDDLMLVGNMLLGREIRMLRLGDSDLYVRSWEMDPGARFEYSFAIFDERRMDLLNPRENDAGGRELSVLTTQGWQEPAHLVKPQGPRGRLDKLDWHSEILDTDREVRIYVPPGYDQGDRRYPVLLVSNGDEALAQGLVDRSLDNLIGKSVAPVIALFVPQGHFTELGTRAGEYLQALETELFPRIDASYRTVTEPGSRGVLATRWAGAQAMYMALERPDLFGKVGAQSMEAGALRDGFLDMVRNAESCDLTIHLEWSSNGYQPVREFGDELVPVLEEAGCRVTRGEFADGIGWGGWRQHTDRMLEHLFPLQ